MYKRIPLPLFFDSPWVNAKMIFPLEKWLILFSIFVFALFPLIFFINKFSSSSDIEYYSFAFMLILGMSSVVISIFAGIYLFFLRKCIQIDENNLTYYFFNKTHKRGNVIARKNIKKIVLEKRVREIGDSSAKHYDVAGTFVKLIVIDDNNIKHELTPEIYSYDGTYPKTWFKFLNTVGDIIGLPVECT